MQAWVFDKNGGTDVLRLKTDHAKPTPGPGQILVAVRAAGVNPVDCKVRAGAMGPSDGSERVLGWDAAGVVEALGEGAAQFSVGDEVYFAGDLTKSGSYAQFTCVDERLAARKPASLSFEDAAALPLVTLTAWEGIAECAQASTDPAVNASKSILVIAAAGGVGSMAVQLAKHVFGFGTVIGTASRDESRKYSLDHGADKVINHRNPFKDEFEAQKIAPVDYVFITTDVDMHFDNAVECAAPGGSLIMITSSNPIDTSKLMFKRLRLCAELMFSRSLFGHEPEKQGKILEATAAAVDAGKIKSTNSETFAWEDVPKAQEKQDAGASIGKTTFKVPSA
jgi:NADPH2:quinone reductase